MILKLYIHNSNYLLDYVPIYIHTFSCCRDVFTLQIRFGSQVRKPMNEYVPKVKQQQYEMFMFRLFMLIALKRTRIVNASSLGQRALWLSQMVVRYHTSHRLDRSSRCGAGVNSTGVNVIVMFTDIFFVNMAWLLVVSKVLFLILLQLPNTLESFPLIIILCDTPSQLTPTFF